MAVSRFSRMYVLPSREILDKFVLLCAFLIGTMGGITLKLLHVHPFIAALFSASVLIAYALIAYWSTSLRVEPETIGDNSYYLGFLFTLTSLAVTLYFVVDAGNNDQARLIPEVISGFGVALVSTIVGVFIRVLMMQFRVDIVARERETRLGLDDTARKLRTEMALSIRRLKDFTVEALQQAAEREVAMKKVTDNILSDTRQAMLDVASSFGAELAKSVKDQSTLAIEEVRNAVTGSSQSSIEAMRHAFEGLALSAQQMNEQNEKAQAALAQTLNQMKSHGMEIAFSIGEMSRQLDQLKEDSSQSSKATSEAMLSATKENAQTLKQAHDALALTISSLDQQLKRLVDDTSSAAPELHIAVKQTSSIIEDARLKLGESLESLNETVRAIASQTKDAGQVLVYGMASASTALTLEVDKIGTRMGINAAEFSKVTNEVVKRIEVDIQRTTERLAQKSTEQGVTSNSTSTVPQMPAATDANV